MGLNSPMKMGEGPITVTLNCAQCGQPVASGVEHVCPKKETKDGSQK